MTLLLAKKRGARANLNLDNIYTSVGFLLQVGQTHTNKCFREVLGDLNLSPVESSILVLVNDNPGVQQGVVAKHLRIKTALMAKLVKQLEASDLIERSVDPNDGRAMNLNVTEQGAELGEELIEAFRAIEARINSRLNENETEQLRGLLQKLVGISK